MDGAGIEKIIQVAKASNDIKLVDIDGVTYTNQTLVAIHEKRPEGDELALSSLTSLVDLIKADVDGWIRDGLAPIVHIVSPTTVYLRGKQMDDAYLTRPDFAVANARVPTFQYNTFHPREVFHIGLLSVFADWAERSKVVAFVGNLKAERSVEINDDGVGQSAGVRSGVSSALIEKATVPNPVQLAPFRSFAEIPPIASPFLFRVKGGGDDGEVKCALFEADGGAWVLHTVDAIYNWLANSLKGIPVHIVR